MLPSRWWRFGQDGGKPAPGAYRPAGWAERVLGDVAASAPEVPGGSSHAEEQRALWAAVDRLSAEEPTAALQSETIPAELRGPLAAAMGAPEVAEAASAAFAAALPEVPAPEPLPKGVLGYSVATRRTLGGGGWLATADIMSLEAAEHTLRVTGGTLVEIREARR